MLFQVADVLSYTKLLPDPPETNISTKHSNRREADELAINKRDRGVEIGSTEKKLQLSSGEGGNKRAICGLEVGCADHWPVSYAWKV